MATRRIPEVLTLDELTTLYATPNPGCLTGLRNGCMLRLMGNVGLRVSEVCGMQIGDLDWQSGRLKIRHGKGGHQRMLWVSDEDLQLLHTWRAQRPVPASYVFSTLKGGPVRTKYVREMIKRVARRAGLSETIHPHRLRHSFATDIYKQTMNIRLVQRALGHADLSTTMIYTHIHDPEVEDAIKNLRRRP